jgi:hypothetical protein
VTEPRTTCVVAGCGKPSPDAFMCTSCAGALAIELFAVPWLRQQLDVTLARQDHVSPTAGASGESGRVLPPKLRAMQAADTLRNTLVPWVRTIAEQRGLPVECADTPQAMSRWLVINVPSVRQSDEAAELHAEVLYAIGQVRRAIDQPPPLCYRGPCDQCGVDLYCAADHRGRPVAAVIKCRVCGSQYDTAKRETWLLSRADDRLATATEIAQALPALYGQQIRPGTIRQWIARKRLTPRAWLHQGRLYPERQHEHDRPLCRVGDVIELARQAQQREQKRGTSG